MVSAKLLHPGFMCGGKPCEENKFRGFKAYWFPRTDSDGALHTERARTPPSQSWVGDMGGGGGGSSKPHTVTRHTRDPDMHAGPVGQGKPRLCARAPLPLLPANIKNKPHISFRAAALHTSFQYVRQSTRTISEKLFVPSVLFAFNSFQFLSNKVYVPIVLTRAS